MSFGLRVTLLVCIVAAGMFLVDAPAAQAAESICDPDGLQSGGAVYRVCMPSEGWNGELVVYAHGYVGYNEPIAIPEDQLSMDDGPSLPEIINGLGYAFAVTSYRVNGLAVREGTEDLLDLVEIFRTDYGIPNRVYLTGPSEGGVITALMMEQYPDVFDGAVSACGPVGSFRGQINYWGDVRVIFNYLFPDVLPGTPAGVPQEVIDNWETVYEPMLEQLFRDQPARRKLLMAIANIPEHPFNLDLTIEGLMDLMWYNVFATNDGIAKLGGHPFDNSRRWYRGSGNDVLLNLSVSRYSADEAALTEMETYYQTRGSLQKPMVMLHTVDPLIPLWHEPLYTRLVDQQGSQALHTSLPALLRYGHCNFTTVQVLVAFVMMVQQVTGDTLVNPERVLETPEQQQEYRELMASLPTLQAPHIHVPDGTLYLPMLPTD